MWQLPKLWQRMCFTLYQNIGSGSGCFTVNPDSQEFISQLKALRNEQKLKHSDTGQQELEEAKKRVQELDSMIQNLYESSMKGLLPERQVQRMIQ